MSQAKPNPAAERKPYQVIAPGHVHQGQPAAVGDTLELPPGLGAVLLRKQIVKEIKR